MINFGPPGGSWQSSVFGPFRHLLPRMPPDASTESVFAVKLCCVPTFRIREAAELLGVSDDTVRRWADTGRVPTSVEAGRRVIDGADLARFAEELAAGVERPRPRRVVGESARNRFTGLVTKVVRDTVMAQVEIQAGPHRFVSLLSREAADELALEPGVIAVASVKATSVVVEVPEHGPSRSDQP